MTKGFASAALVTLGLTLTACGTTTVVTGPSTTALGATTTVPTGTVDDLLSRLESRAFALSVAINDGDSQAAFDEIQALWAAASAQLPRTDFVLSVDRQIGLMKVAVDRRRAADADKAARNLKALIDTRV